MNTIESKTYKASYDLHRLFYETAEESRNVDFWRQIENGIASIGKHSSQCQIATLLIHDVIFAYEQHASVEQRKANVARENALKREREEIEKEESRKKAVAEVERLERELEQARAAL